jgi:RNA polymerase sigma-B factor
MHLRIVSRGDPLAQGRMGDRRLMRQHRCGNRHARALMIERHMPLARSLASRYLRSGEPADDLVQVAAVGLVKAVDQWDPERGPAFSSYAVPTILGELRHYFRDSTWYVRPPRAVQEVFLAIEHARAGVEAATGRPATVIDLAGHLRRSPKAIANGLGATDCRQPRSLEDPIVDGDDTGTLADIVGAGDAGYEQAEARATVAGLARILSDRDREVIRLRFEHGLLQSEIAERVGCSQMHVSRILRYSIDAMALHARLAA